MFFLTAPGGSLIAAELETDQGFRVLQRETLFGLETEWIFGPGVDMYDVAPDDQQFLVIRLGIDATVVAGDARFILVQNFFEQLKKQVGN